MTRRADQGRRLAAVVIVAACTLATPLTASAFCRTTTSNVPADYDPSISGCWQQGLPLYWANACVSYDLQQDASDQISYNDAANGLATAFSKWTSTDCLESTGRSGRVSIDVRDFGPVACDLVQYDQSGPNQHAIIFRDNEWPYDDTSNTLALTTVTYNTETGEIFDADMEINTHSQTLSISAVVPTGGYDFESIVTHETGHFLGMAHSDDERATMYAHYTPGEDVMRSLTADDVSGICTIYAPDGNREVAQAASATGVLMQEACDPTPRHGFTTQCMPASSSCSVSRGAGRSGSSGAGPLLGLMGVASLLRARRRRAKPPSR